MIHLLPCDSAIHVVADRFSFPDVFTARMFAETSMPETVQSVGSSNETKTRQTAALSIQPKKNTVLKSHGRPPWSVPPHSLDAQPQGFDLGTEWMASLSVTPLSSGLLVRAIVQSVATNSFRCRAGGSASGKVGPLLCCPYKSPNLLIESLQRLMLRAKSCSPWDLSRQS